MPLIFGKQTRKIGYRGNGQRKGEAEEGLIERDRYRFYWKDGSFVLRIFSKGIFEKGKFRIEKIN